MADSALLKLLKVQTSVLSHHFAYIAKINELGFIETPYRRVDEGKVDLTNEGIVYMSAEEEEARIIAQANAIIDDQGIFVNQRLKPVLTVTFHWLTIKQ
jgi:DNA-directed RNA polymerase beta subunit